MDEKKFCFITCVNDSELYSECIKYINNLNIPEGYEIETIAMTNAKSITSGYNEAMESSDAKYKVYLHQDVFIINKDFIKDIVDIFNSDEKVGILGVVGAKTIPTNGVWWDAFQRFGEVYENHTGIMKLLEFDEIKDSYAEVKALDGFMLVTQYDIPWREDIFTGWHFYDISQCVEFTLNDYKAVIPKQEEPWCVHDCGFVETTGDYDKYKEVFLDEYASRIFPLVSIIITANRPEYFKVALESAINQSYKNIQIVVCDNSESDMIEKICLQYLNNKNIKYYKNNINLHKIEKLNKVIKMINTEYLCFLKDDNVFNTDKLKIMMNYFIQNLEISLVTSHTQIINEDETISINETQKLFYKATYLNSSYIKKVFLSTRKNFLGDIDNSIFKRKYFQNHRLGVYNNREYLIISDIATWLNMSEKGDVLYLPDTLSYIRINDAKNEKHVINKYKGVQETVLLSLDLLEKDYIEFIKKKNTIFYNLIKVIMNTIDILIKDDTIISFFIENNVIIELLYSFKKLISYIKDSDEIKDVFIKNYYDETIKKIMINHKFNSELSKEVVNKNDKKVINSFVDKEVFAEYLINLYNFQDGEYKEFRENKVNFSKDDVKYITFYLPQFHTIPENDKWWGKGFTEWTNVTRAVPMFVNHYQPHLPGELGFYNLNDVSAMRRQVDLALNYGIYGFCFYYYWFNGKRLLEKPIDNFFENKDINFPFCLCWANENWTRRWSGSEEDVLISQNHNHKSDMAFIKDILKYFKDKRYIKVNDRPLLIVYRADIIPNIRQTVDGWRNYCRKSGVGEIYIVGAETFSFTDPLEYGFDASVQFPPHKLINYNARIDKFSTLNRKFDGAIFDYRKLVEDKQYLDDKGYKSFKTAFPSWDNTSRKPNSSFIFHGSNPNLYEKWLENITVYTKNKFEDEERLVFINAWNEWAEGAHLEPDRRFGYAYLESTYNVFMKQKNEQMESIK